MRALYSNGDSTIWGAELDDKEKERFSSIVADKLGWIDCNNASSGVSNDYIYRQTLRDLPQTYANAADVIWPTAPGA